MLSAFRTALQVRVELASVLIGELEVNGDGGEFLGAGMVGHDPFANALLARIVSHATVSP